MHRRGLPGSVTLLLLMLLSGILSAVAADPPEAAPPPKNRGRGTGRRKNELAPADGPAEGGTRCQTAERGSPKNQRLLRFPRQLHRRNLASRRYKAAAVIIGGESGETCQQRGPGPAVVG